MADNKIKILIVDDIPEARENLKKLLAFEPDIDVIGVAGTGREAVQLAGELHPHIVLMDINMPDMDGITATREIRRLSPSVGVVMMSVQGEVEYVRRAMAAGARDFLTKPAPAEELYATVRSVYESMAEMRNNAAAMPMMTSGTGGAQKVAVDRGRTTYVIAVYSPQGGSGKTTIATNMAAGLMREGTKVLLIDGKVQFGDVGIFLNLRATGTIIDLLGDVDNLDMDLVESVLMTHESGLRVLLPPQRPEEAELVQGEQFRKIVEGMRGAFDFVVVDLSSRLDDIALNVLEIADRIIMVATPTLPAVIHSLTFLGLLDELNYPPEKTQLVLNKVTPDLERAKVALASGMIEQKFKRKALGIIPMDERRVLYAVNRGYSIIAKDQNLSPARELLALAEALRVNLQPVEEAAPAAAEPQKKGGIFSIRK